MSVEQLGYEGDSGITPAGIQTFIDNKLREVPLMREASGAIQEWESQAQKLKDEATKHIKDVVSEYQAGRGNASLTPEDAQKIIGMAVERAVASGQANRWIDPATADRLFTALKGVSFQEEKARRTGEMPPATQQQEPPMS